MIKNHYAGQFVENLEPLYDLGAEIERDAAILHPRLGKPVREAVGKGDDIIPFVFYPFTRVRVSSSPSWLNLMLKVEPLSFQTCMNDHSDVFPFADFASTVTI